MVLFRYSPIQLNSYTYAALLLSERIVYSVQCNRVLTKKIHLNINAKDPVMKKLILILIAGICLTTIGVALYLLSNAQQLAEKYKPELERSASNALGAQVTLGTVSANIFPNVYIAFDTVEIARSKSDAEKLSLQQIVLDIEPLALLRGALVINEFSITKPHITVVKENGKTWIQGLPAEKKAAQIKNNTTSDEPAAKNKKSASKVPAALSFALNAIAIKDGQITIDDRDQKRLYAIKDLNLLSAVTLTDGEIHLPESTLKLNALHAIPVVISANNIRYNTETKLLTVPDNSIRISNNTINQNASVHTETLKGTVHIQASEFDPADLLAALASTIPNLNQFKMSGTFSQNIDITLESATDFALKGTTSLSQIGVTKDAFNISALTGVIGVSATKNKNGISTETKTKGLELAFNKSPLTMDFTALSTPTTVEVSKLNINGFDGTVSTTINVAITKDKHFSTGISARNINLGELIKAGLPGIPHSVHGTLVNLDLNVSGNNTRALKESLTGNGTLLIQDGRITGVNIARATLEALKLPFLENNIYEQVPEEFQTYFNEEDSEIKRLTSDWRIQNQALQLKSLELESSFYTLSGTGTISFEKYLDLKTQLTFSKEFSEKFVAKTKEAKYLQNTEGLIVIPLAISGSSPKIILTPDTEKLLTLQAGRALEDRAGKALDKVFGEKNAEKSNAIKNLLGLGK